MKFFILLLSLFISLNADLILKKTLACPSIDSLQKAVHVDMSDPLALEMYSIAHGCRILAKEDKVQALGYDPRNTQVIYQKILYKRTNVELYILRSALQVEQGGKKNSYRF